MNKKIKGLLVATGIGMTEGAITYAVIDGHLKKEGWTYNKATKQYEYKADGIGSHVVVTAKQLEAEQYKSTAYMALGIIAITTGLLVRKFTK